MLNKMSKKIGLILALILIVSIFLTACGGQEAEDVEGAEGPDQQEELENNEEEAKTEKTVQDIIDSGKVILGTSADYPPFEFHALIDGNDQIVGFDISIAKYIAEELGVELEIRDMEFGSLLGALGTGMVDMVIAGMNPDPERDANFTDIYYESDQAVLVTKDNPHNIKVFEDLNGKRIGVQIGTTQEDVAQDEVDAKEVLSLDTNPDIVMNLMTNKIDCALMETPVAEAFAKANDEIIVVEGLNIDSGTDGIAIAVKSGNDELTEKLNQILAEIKAKGLMEEWFTEADELSLEEI